VNTRGKNTQEWSEDTAGANLSDHDDEAAPRDIRLGTRYSPKTVSTINLLDDHVIPYDLIMRLLVFVCFEPAYAEYSPAILVFLPGIAEIRRLNDLLAEHDVFGSTHGFVIYLLHSSISSENQAAVFEVPPSGIRKIVLGRQMRVDAIVANVLSSYEHRRDWNNHPRHHMRDRLWKAQGNEVSFVLRICTIRMSDAQQIRRETAIQPSRRDIRSEEQRSPEKRSGRQSSEGPMLPSIYEDSS
jgi:hypothetical protein